MNLYADVDARGELRLAFPAKEPGEMRASCALDLADLGGITLDEVAQVLGVTRQRVQQIESRALAKLHRSAHEGPLADLLDDTFDQGSTPLGPTRLGREIVSGHARTCSDTTPAHWAQYETRSLTAVFPRGES